MWKQPSYCAIQQGERGWGVNLGTQELLHLAQSSESIDTDKKNGPNVHRAINDIDDVRNNSFV